MAVSKRLRYEILRRDNHTCRYCGAAAPDVPLTVDHVVPTALGGSDEPTNLVAACRDCNSGKSASAPDAPIVADVEADALRWAAAIRKAADKQLNDLETETTITGWFDTVWGAWHDDRGNALPRPADWRRTVMRFVNAELAMPVLEDGVQKAMTNERIASGRAWNYFCGICWRKIKELQDAARALLATEVDS